MIIGPAAVAPPAGRIPFRMALAGGWIDQPFVSAHNPEPPGSMVVVSLRPIAFYMDRCGMATSTRAAAARLWPDGLPKGDPAELTRALYREENRGRAEPSGSQDMAGLIYPGVSRLDYDCACEGGYFPAQVESNTDPEIARWLEKVIRMVPIAQRPLGYNPLGVKHLDPEWIRRLGRSGKDCYAAILARDVRALGAALNECMLCWENILPQTILHPAIRVNLKAILNFYQDQYAGAMYSGCGGGYLYVASEEPVPGAMPVYVRESDSEERIPSTV
jgi:hypothetical protein